MGSQWFYYRRCQGHHLDHISVISVTLVDPKIGNKRKKYVITHDHLTHAMNIATEDARR